MGNAFTGNQILEWEGWELDEPTEVNGSVLEFAFGPRDQCYIATSYPYRPQYAKDDIRSMEVQNLPAEIWKQIELMRPRYVMNIAFQRKPLTWVIYCYRGRYAYDSKWRPRKPDTNSGKLGATLDYWKKHESDQVSYCAYGDHPDKWFMRSTNGETKWYSQLGPQASTELQWRFNNFQQEQQRKVSKNGKVFSASTIRAVTFGPGDTWILYSQRDFAWSENGLPSSLVAALKEGHDSERVINVRLHSVLLVIEANEYQKAVLNPFNRNEYVLVYDHGPVYCSFDPAFQERFERIVKEWATSMKRYKWRANETSSIHWKDPAVVANESFLSPEPDEEEEGLKISSSGSRDPSFSEVRGTQPVNGAKGRPTNEQRSSNETQISQLSSHSPNHRNNFGVINEAHHTLQPQEFTENARLGIARTPQSTKPVARPPASSNSELYHSPSMVAPERVRSQELRLRGHEEWNSPVPDVQAEADRRTGQTRAEEVRSLTRLDGVKLAISGKVPTPRKR